MARAVAVTPNRRVRKSGSGASCGGQSAQVPRAWTGDPWSGEGQLLYVRILGINGSNKLCGPGGEYVCSRVRYTVPDAVPRFSSPRGGPSLVLCAHILQVQLNAAGFGESRMYGALLSIINTPDTSLVVNAPAPFMCPSSSCAPSSCL